MKIKEVPQQVESSILAGNRRACYAQDDEGRYVVVPSKGWEVESIVNGEAVAEIHERVEQARQHVLAGEASPLAYHMERCQMTVGLLSANTGIWRWRVKRHLKPGAFARLNTSLLARYAFALGVGVDDLCRVPDQALKDGS